MNEETVINDPIGALPTIEHEGKKMVKILPNKKKSKKPKKHRRPQKTDAQRKAASDRMKEFHRLRREKHAEEVGAATPEQVGNAIKAEVKRLTAEKKKEREAADITIPEEHSTVVATLEREGVLEPSVMHSGDVNVSAGIDRVTSIVNAAPIPQGMDTAFKTFVTELGNAHEKVDIEPHELSLISYKFAQKAAEGRDLRVNATALYSLLSEL